MSENLKNIKSTIKDKITCSNTLGVMYLLVFILAIILAGVTIKEGKSEKKMVSWTLFSFSIIFGVVVLALLYFLKCNSSESAKKAKQIAIPVLTVVLCLSNFVGMIISKPDLPFSQLFSPHLVNMVLLIGSIFLGFGICSNSKSVTLESPVESAGEG
jgi:Na+/proline symporter